MFSSVYYIAEIDGGERIIITNNISSLKSNLRYGYDRAIRVIKPNGKCLMVREPITAHPSKIKSTSLIIQYAIRYGQSRRNKGITL
jgi:hypothetical protein